jgi:NAD+-dependent protein deacetylase SIR2
MSGSLMHLPEERLLDRSHDDIYFDAASDISSPLSSIPSSPLSSPPNSPILPATWRTLTPPPSQENADDDMLPARKRRKVEPKPRTTQHLDLSSDTSQSEYDRRVALDLLLKTLRKRKKIVVVAGAGISVSAGIPDFRSSHGLFTTLRREHKLKASGKELFDASVYKDDSSTSSFHDMVRDLSNMAAKATPTPFHHLLARLAQEGRLLRLYTQNVDGIDTSLPPLATQVPLHHKGPWPQTIQLHGGLEKMMCQKCRHTSDFQPDLFQGPKPPPCPECEVKDALRTSHAGKRSHGIGKLRPRIVLYNEHNPDEEAIGAVMTSDLRSRPDAIIVVGTTMKIPGVKRIVREMCGVVRSKQNGISMWINQDPVPPGKEFEDCWDLVVTGECDEVARQADFKHWDDVIPETIEEYTLSEGERVKSSQGEIRVVIPETPKKNKDNMKKGPLNLGGMMTPPVSMDDEMSDRPLAINQEKKGKKNSPAKTKLKFVMKNPASLGRSISEVLGKENKTKQSRRTKGSLNKRSLPKTNASGAQGVITAKVTKQVGCSKAPSAIKEPLSPRSNINGNILLFPNLSQQYSSTEPSPAPESLAENDWRNGDTISPNQSIPNGMARLLN